MPFKFGGQDILGSEHRGTRTVCGGAESSRQRFRMPGLTGEFEHVLPLGSQPIIVTSILKVTDNSTLKQNAEALQAILDGLDGLKADDTQQTIIDGFGREYDNCVLDDYEPLGPVRILVDGKGVMQDVRLYFRKLY